MRACSTLTLLLVALALTSCNNSDATSNSATPANEDSATTDSARPAPVALPTTSEITTVDASGYVLLDYLRPLDDGRIEIATPDGWKWVSQPSKSIVRFVEIEGGGGLPRIEVTVEENNLDGFTDVTTANVADFTAAVAKDLETSITSIIEPPIPMVIGSVPCARYVSKLKLKIGAGTIPAERQTLELLHAGRRYKINLLIEPDELKESCESRDAAYAVCSAVRFPAVESPATE